MKKILLFIWMILGGISSIYAQEKKEQPAPPPAIPIEFLPGSDRFYFQSILSRDIPLTNNKLRFISHLIPCLAKSNPSLTNNKLRFISVINYATEYHNENAFKNDFVSVNTISYKITKHIGIGPSAANVAGLGWIPSVGFQFGWRKSSWALTFNPAISINKHTNTNNVLILEYFPAISKNNSWRLYSRFQALYIHQLVNDTHMRSSYFGRLGVSYKQFTIGAGVNVDYYTASKKQKQNYGPFLRILL